MKVECFLQKKKHAMLSSKHEEITFPYEFAIVFIPFLLGVTLSKEC